MNQAFNQTHQRNLHLSNETNNFTHRAATNASQDIGYVDPAKVIVWTTITLLICLFGCFNNGLVLWVTWPRSGDKSGVNLLIFHFIFANLLNVLINYPIRCIMVQARQAGYVATMKHCYFVQTLTSVNWMVVYWADAGLALNRCVALFLPHSYKSFSTRRNNVFQIVLMWVFSFAILMPYNFGEGGRLVVLNIGHCAYRTTNAAYGVFFSNFKNAPFILAGLASALIFGKCIMMTRATALMGGGHDGDRNNSVVRHRIRLAQMLVLTYLWGVLCNVPSGFITASYPAIFERDPTLNLWLQTAAICQYAFSACILLVSNNKYKERLQRVTHRIMPLENTLSAMDGPRTKTLRLSVVNSISRTVENDM